MNLTEDCNKFKMLVPTALNRCTQKIQIIIANCTEYFWSKYKP